jgi:hypothetical protein
MHVVRSGGTEGPGPATSPWSLMAIPLCPVAVREGCRGRGKLSRRKTKAMLEAVGIGWWMEASPCDLAAVVFTAKRLRLAEVARAQCEADIRFGPSSEVHWKQWIVASVRLENQAGRPVRAVVDGEAQADGRPPPGCPAP